MFIQSTETQRLAALPDRALACRLARIAAGVTQQQIADRLGFSVQYVCHAESVRSKLSDRQAARILAAIAELSR